MRASVYPLLPISKTHPYKVGIKTAPTIAIKMQLQVLYSFPVLPSMATPQINRKETAISSSC